MGWNRGGAIWRDAEAGRIVGRPNGGESRARAGVHLSHSEPVLCAPPRLLRTGWGEVKAKPDSPGSLQALTEGQGGPRPPLHAQALPSTHLRRPAPGPWTPFTHLRPKDCGQEGPLRSFSLSCITVQPPCLCSSRTQVVTLCFHGFGLIRPWPTALSESGGFQGSRSFLGRHSPALLPARCSSSITPAVPGSGHPSPPCTAGAEGKHTSPPGLQAALQGALPPLAPMPACVLTGP